MKSRFYISSVIFLVFFSFFVLWWLSPQKINSAYHDELLSIINGDHVVEFRVEIADTPEKRNLGLMYRKTMPSDSGMLFCFDKIKPVFMWMKNTILPLDMIFINHHGNIVSITENTVPFSEKIIASGEPVLFVLELNAGSVSKFNIKNGNKVKHPVILSCTS